MKVKHKFSGGFLIIFLIAFIILNCFLGKAFINYHENKIKNEMIRFGENILPMMDQVSNVISKTADWFGKMSEEEQLELLATDGMLVKRPLLVLEDRVIPGFKEKEWLEGLGL